jgi:hypothetical protein
MSTTTTRLSRSAPWLAAAVGAMLSVAQFWPGLMSADSAMQFAQARGQVPLDDVHPVAMSLLWRVLDRVFEGPGAIFALFVLTWWSALAWWAQSSPASAVRRVVLVLAVGLWPATFLMLGHVWKDVGMCAALLLAGAAIWQWRTHGGVAARVASVVLLAIACSFRHNAVFAALPLLLWWSWPRAGEAPRLWRRVALFGVAAVAFAAVPGTLARLAGADARHAWTFVAHWDLAAVSLATGEVKLPSGMLAGPPLEVEQLRPVFDPWANPRLYDVGRIKASYFFRFTPEQLAELRTAWWRSAWDEPAAYLAHRARLSRYLLFGFPPELPRELIYVPERRLAVQPAPVLPAVDTDTAYWRVMDRARGTLLFGGALYLGFALFAALLTMRAAAAPVRAPVMALAASAWANALPLFVIAGSAEFRYLAWTALASVLALGLVLGRSRHHIG